MAVRVDVTHRFPSGARVGSKVSLSALLHPWQPRRVVVYCGLLGSVEARLRGRVEVADVADLVPGEAIGP